jgi:hypothetical protein
MSPVCPCALILNNTPNHIFSIAPEPRFVVAVTFLLNTENEFQFHREFQFIICHGPTNAFVCNKTLIQMSHIKTLKITPTCFDH